MVGLRSPLFVHGRRNCQVRSDSSSDPHLASTASRAWLLSTASPRPASVFESRELPCLSSSRLCTIIPCRQHLSSLIVVVASRPHLLHTYQVPCLPNLLDRHLLRQKFGTIYLTSLDGRAHFTLLTLPHRPQSRRLHPELSFPLLSRHGRHPAGS